MDNIQVQAEEFLAAHKQQKAAAPPADIATVAVVAGEGMEQVFQSMGVTAIVEGGPT
ncbi:MAG: hypothetical protein GWN58_40920, partial [Anaerolineae bacterium]|nr:hypothetical protein [Anaerolineae bacterium]